MRDAVDLRRVCCSSDVGVGVVGVSASFGEIRWGPGDANLAPARPVHVAKLNVEGRNDISSEVRYQNQRSTVRLEENIEACCAYSRRRKREEGDHRSPS